MQAERAMEAPAAFLPEHARVLRDGTRQEIGTGGGRRGAIHRDGA